MSPVVEALWLMFPVILAGALHMVVVRKDLLPSLRVPINTALFGANKTWRGFVVMPLACLLGVYASHAMQMLAGYEESSFRGANLLGLGLALGLGYCLGELPNSYMKRRLGIPPGQTLRAYRWLTLVSDHLDSLIGCLAVYMALVGTSPLVALWIVILGPVVHLLVNLLLYAADYRRHAL